MSGINWVTDLLYLAVPISWQFWSVYGQFSLSEGQFSLSEGPSPIVLWSGKSV